MKWEKLILWILKIRPFDQENPFLQYRIRKYRGENLTFSNESMISKDDLIVELHLNNEQLMEMAANSRSDIQLAIKIVRGVEQLLPKIAMMIKEKTGQEVKALYGITMIYRGSEQLGFHVISMPKGVFSFFTHIYLRCLLSVLHVQGNKRLQKKREILVPKIIVMPVNQLNQRYQQG